MLAVVDLLLVGDVRNWEFICLDGCLEVESRIGLDLSEGLCDTRGGITSAEGIHDWV
jgi:hypothetical protein